MQNFLDKFKKKKYVKIKNADNTVQKATATTAKTKASGKKSGKSQKEKTPLRRAMGIIGTTFAVMGLILVITTCIVATVITTYVLQFADENYDGANIRDIDVQLTSFVYAYDKEGNEVEIKALNTDQNRIWIPLEDMSPNIINAVISTEDKRFYDHDGVDWYRIAGVALSSSGQGGSTITMQLIRDVTNDKDISEERKLREIFRALSLEEQYTKDDIIESYLNRIWFGGGTIYGIGAASSYYFDKLPSQLTIAESAMIAGLIRNPSKLSPYVNLEKSKERQLYALENMYTQGIISTGEYEAAKKEQVKFRYPVEGDAYGYIDERFYNQDEDDTPVSEEPKQTEYEAYRWNEYKVTQSWYVDAGINQAIQHLAKKRGISYETAEKELKTGGYKIYLNVDLEMQEKLEALYKDPYHVLKSYNKSDLPKDLLQSAFVVMDYMGNVKAVAGGLGDKPGDGVLNRATQSYRAPGSTIKPLSAYSVAIEKNLITYSSMLTDLPIELKKPNGDKYLWPENYGGKQGTGAQIAAWRAVMESKNTIAARTVQMVGLRTAYDQLQQRLGFTDLNPAMDIDYSPMATGALSNGVRLYEITAAYQIFGNGGLYYEPYLYSKVTDNDGKIILEKYDTGLRAISKDTAWITNRMIYKVVNGDSGTGGYAKLNNIEVVGKTGTSNDEKNLMFIGATPQYVAGVWLGYDDSKIIPKNTWKPIARIWGDTMKHLVDTSKKQTFVEEPTVLKRDYCTESGDLATSNCPHTDVGYYRASNLPKTCEIHG